MSTRHDQREQAFAIIFESSFSNNSLNEIIEDAVDARDLVVSQFAIKLANGVAENLEKIDEIIETKAVGWSKKRIGKVSLATLRLAIYEMYFEDDIPVGASINEAVEITKTFATEEDSAFVNGILGNVAKEIEKK